MGYGTRSRFMDNIGEVMEEFWQTGITPHFPFMHLHDLSRPNIVKTRRYRDFINSLFPHVMYETPVIAIRMNKKVTKGVIYTVIGVSDDSYCLQDVTQPVKKSNFMKAHTVTCHMYQGKDVNEPICIHEAWKCSRRWFYVAATWAVNRDLISLCGPIQCHFPLNVEKECIVSKLPQDIYYSRDMHREYMVVPLGIPSVGFKSYVPKRQRVGNVVLKQHMADAVTSEYTIKMRKDGAVRVYSTKFNGARDLDTQFIGDSALERAKRCRDEAVRRKLEVTNKKK